MKIIVFDIKGAFAHFRKFYANSTSLSYDFPPRTAVCGMIAAILGLERDSYYSLFNEDNASMAVQILSPTKRISQTLNYLWIKDPKDFNASSGHMQVPVEWVVHKDGIGRGLVAYRIFFNHTDPDLHEKLLNLIVQSKSEFPVYLGVTEAPAAICLVGEGGFSAAEYDSLSSPLEISTVCPVHKLRKIIFSKDGEVRRTYMRDRVPCSFLSDRTLETMTQVLYEPNGHSIIAEVESGVKQIRINNEATNIVFLESAKEEAKTNV